MVTAVLALREAGATVVEWDGLRVEFGPPRRVLAASADASQSDGTGLPAESATDADEDILYHSSG